ncbi:MAG: hypothetical protein ACLR6O_02240 [Eubacterium sp.]
MITEEERQKMRKKRQRARKRKRVRKKILLIIAAIIILLAVFIVTVKLVNPDFDIASYLPSGKAQQAVEMIDSKLFNKTTTTTLPTTQKETTTKARNIKKADYDYDDFSVFAFDTSLQGNQVGNLLNKSNGAVTYSSAYIYYSIEGKGIFRFEPNEEKNAKYQR